MYSQGLRYKLCVLRALSSSILPLKKFGLNLLKKGLYNGALSPRSDHHAQQGPSSMGESWFPKWVPKSQERAPEAHKRPRCAQQSVPAAWKGPLLPLCGLLELRWPCSPEEALSYTVVGPTSWNGPLGFQSGVPRAPTGACSPEGKPSDASESLKHGRVLGFPNGPIKLRVVALKPRRSLIVHNRGHASWKGFVSPEEGPSSSVWAPQLGSHGPHFFLCIWSYLFNACFQPCKTRTKNSHCKKLVFLRTPLLHMAYSWLCDIIFIGHP